VRWPYCLRPRPLLAVRLMFDANICATRGTCASPRSHLTHLTAVLDAGFDQCLSDGRWSTCSSARQLVDTPRGVHAQRRLLSDIKVGIVPDEYDLFSRAFFDPVRCSHDPGGSRTPCTFAAHRCLPFSRSLAPSCRIAAACEVARPSPDALLLTLWCIQLLIYRPKGCPSAHRAAHGCRWSRRAAALLAPRGVHEWSPHIGPRADRISVDCTLAR